MDDFWWLSRGVAIGLALAIPVGPIALLCMRRTLERGFLVGFATGLGAAIADLVYATIAAFGIGAVETVLLAYRTPLSFVGGIFLVSLAWRIGFSKTTVMREVDSTTKGLPSALISGLLLTATNPLTVLGFVAIFAGFGVGRGLTDTGRAVSLTIGVGVGSVLWWVTLTAIIARIRHFFEPGTLNAINRGAAVLIAAFGFYELIIAVRQAAPWLF